MNNTKGKERRDNKSRRLCLLHKKDKEYLSKFAVVPHAGTWIEIYPYNHAFQLNTVVPHAGTWIEMPVFGHCAPDRYRRSPRGNVDWNTWIIWNASRSFVVPHAGTWIEIPYLQARGTTRWCRSPRGNVDWNNKWNIPIICDISSFPTRERGLKFPVKNVRFPPVQSFPTRERGLKLRRV